MIKLQFFTTLFLVFIISVPLTAQSEWIKTFGKRYDNGGGTPFTKIDKNGNIYLTGKNDAISFDNNTTISGCYLVKMDSLGKVIWQKQIADNLLNNEVLGFAAADNGDVVVAIHVKENTTVFGQVTIDFNGGTAIARYRTDGQLLWAKQTEVPLPFTRYFELDDQNNIYTFYVKSGNVDNEYFLMKISGANGSLLLNKPFIRFESLYYTSLNSMVTDKSGNTYIGGNCKLDSLAVNGQYFTLKNSAFCIKLNSEGNLIWFSSPLTAGGRINDYERAASISGLTLSEDGARLYAVGISAVNTQFGEGMTNGENQNFFTKINPNTGAFQWINSVNPTVNIRKVISEGENTWLNLTKYSSSSSETPVTLEGGIKLNIPPFFSMFGSTVSHERAFVIPINDATGDMKPFSILSDEAQYSYIGFNKNRIIGVSNNLGKVYGQDSVYQLTSNNSISIFSLPRSLLKYQPALKLDSLTAKGLCQNGLVKVLATTQNIRLGNDFKLLYDFPGQTYSSYFNLNNGRVLDTASYPYLDILWLYNAYRVPMKARICSSSPLWCSEPLDFIPSTIISNDTTICYGSSIELRAAMGQNYQWSPARLFPNPNAAVNNIKPDTALTIYLSAKSPLGCTDIDSVKVNTVRSIFNLPDTIRLSCNDFDDHFTLDAASKGGFHTNLSYTWKNADSDLDFTSTDNIGAIKDVYPTRSGIYTVVVRDGFYNCNFYDTTRTIIEPCKILKGRTASSSLNVEVLQRPIVDSVDWRLVKRVNANRYGEYQVRLPMKDYAKVRFNIDENLIKTASQTTFPMYYDSTFFISQSKTVQLINVDTIILNGNRWKQDRNNKTSSVLGYVFNYYQPNEPINNYELFMVDSNFYAEKRLFGEYTDDAQIAYDKTDSTGRFFIKVNEKPDVTYQFYGNRMDTKIDTTIAPKLKIPIQSAITNIILYKKDSMLIACNDCGQFKGNIFIDANNNCLPDATDKRVSNAIVQINPGNILVSASDSGQFAIYLKAGNYTVSTTPPQYYVESCSTNGTNTVNFTLNGNTIEKNLGFKPIPNISDIATELTAETAFRPGFEASFQLDVVNRGTTPVPATVKFIYPEAATAVGTNPVVDSDNNRQLTWTIPSLAVGEIKRYRILMRINADVNLLGKKAVFMSQVDLKNNQVDANIADNVDSVSQVIKGSYDPNDKQVFPKGAYLGNQVLPSVESYEFLIRFQNTGTDTAFTVVVRDTLNDVWNAAQLNTISSSHPYSFSLEKNKIAVWTFKSILLPDSTTNEIQSHGFVKFNIKTKTTPLSIGSVLKNKADIYFDYNPPIITNEIALNVVNKLVSGVRDIEPIIAHIHPNPVSDFLTIELTEFSASTQITVQNTLGQVLKTEKITTNQHILEVKNFPSGFYLLSIQQGNRHQKISFIVH